MPCYYRPTAFVLSSLFVVALVGCKPPDKAEGRRESSSTKQEASEVSPVVPPGFTELKEAGVHLVVGSSGLPIEADFTGIEITDSMAESLASLFSLNKLTITQSALTNDGWLAVGHLTELQQCDLRGCPLNNEQLKLAVDGMSKLRALRLSGKSGATIVDDDGLEVLAHCQELKALALDHLWVSEAGLAHLSENAKLTELYLASTLVEDAAMSVVAQLPQLRKLRLAQTSVGAAGMQQLSALPIEDLDVSECSQIADDALVSIGKMKSLKRLNLWRDPVTDTGVSELAGLSELQWLNLDNTQLTDAGLVHLSQLDRLTFLHLGSTSVSDAGMPSLLGLKALKDLKVTRTAVTEQGVHVIADGIPGVSVQLKYVEGQ